MSQIQPPPTYAEVMLKGTNGEAFFNPIWLDWFLTLAAVISASGGSGGTLQHNSLSGLQGGSANEYYHVTASQDTLIGAISGLSTGIISITGTGTAAVRTITGTASELTVTDGDGVAGNPTISLPTAVVAPGSVAVTTGFSCNGASPQTPYASGGAAPAGGTGTAAGGWDTAAHRDAAITLLNNIRSALLANGIMS